MCRRLTEDLKSISPRITELDDGGWGDIAQTGRHAAVVRMPGSHRQEGTARIHVA